MSCSVHDSIMVEVAGTPAVHICTDVFAETARTHAARYGMPDLTISVISNPLSGVSEDEVRRRAREALPSILEGLTEG